MLTLSSSPFEALQNLSTSRNIVFTYFQVCVIEMASSQNGKIYKVLCSCEAGDVPFMDSELLSCLKLLKIDVGKSRLSRIGSVVQTSVFHEIDIESQKQNGYA